jgi:hypothetical protein
MDGEFVVTAPSMLPSHTKLTDELFSVRGHWSGTEMSIVSHSITDSGATDALILIVWLYIRVGSEIGAFMVTVSDATRNSHCIGAFIVIERHASLASSLICSLITMD